MILSFITRIVGSSHCRINKGTDINCWAAVCKHSPLLVNNEHSVSYSHTALSG